ncbi:hypothetical protein F7725_004051 [Dissostichus mawsoni]|uniref:Endonuclease/exonuclease/phosphatase domain-containing protein n=1 Tax=Dissostichus mawsoni TaxID=36200 RepID=A0A7J5YCW4_DISMA|nr:hypothetical protein F7725_004051 [Dissostichus mawsoni]
MRLLFSLSLLLALLHVTSCLLIGAFNIKQFGDKKSSNTSLIDVISTYKYIVSEPLGRSTYQEQYLFLYTFIYLRFAQSFYEIETLFQNVLPHVSSPGSRRSVKDFVLIPQHTSPDSAVKEVNSLFDVVTDVRARWNTNNILLMGDFNAGCSYVSGADWQQIRLFTDKSFHWLIKDDVDTTASGVSDHYPVEHLHVPAERLLDGVFGYEVDKVLDVGLSVDVSLSMVFFLIMDLLVHQSDLQSISWFVEESS